MKDVRGELVIYPYLGFGLGGLGLSLNWLGSTNWYVTRGTVVGGGGWEEGGSLSGGDCFFDENFCASFRKGVRSRALAPSLNFLLDWG